MAKHFFIDLYFFRIPFISLPPLLFQCTRFFSLISLYFSYFRIRFGRVMRIALRRLWLRTANTLQRFWRKIMAVNMATLRAQKVISISGFQFDLEIIFLFWFFYFVLL